MIEQNSHTAAFGVDTCTKSMMDNVLFQRGSTIIQKYEPLSLEPTADMNRTLALSGAFTTSVFGRIHGIHALRESPLMRRSLIETGHCMPRLIDQCRQRATR